MDLAMGGSTGMGGKRLHWTQRRFGERNFELRSTDEVLGSLRWERVLGTLATGTFQGKSWTFKRIGFWNPRITLREEGSAENIGVFHPSLWGGGTLTLRSRRNFDWTTRNVWMTEWAFVDEGGRTMFAMQEGKEDARWSDAFKTQAVVEIEPTGEECSVLPLLILLGWYLFVLRQDDSAATIGATTAS